MQFSYMPMDISQDVVLVTGIQLLFTTTIFFLVKREFHSKLKSKPRFKIEPVAVQAMAISL